MAYNGSGTFSLVAGNPVVTGTTISSTWANNTLSDLATGLTTAICKDGQTTVTANLPMAGFKHTGVAVGSALTDYARYDQLQNSTPQLLSSVAGTNTVTATATPTPAAYVRGQVFRFTPAATNTAAATLNVSSLGAGAVQYMGAALVGGEMVIGVPLDVFVSTSTPVFEIGTSGLTATALSGTTSTTFTFDGSGGTSGSVTVTWRKIGNWVTLHIPTVTATSGTGSVIFTSNTAISATARPAADQFSVNVPIQNNAGASAAAGRVSVTTGGVINILRDNASTAFTNSSACGVLVPFTFSYFVG